MFAQWNQEINQKAFLRKDLIQVTWKTTDQQVDHKRGRNITNLERS